MRSWRDRIDWAHTLLPNSPTWPIATVRYSLDSASTFGAHNSAVVPSPCNSTSIGAPGGPLMRTNVEPNVVGTIRSSDTIGHSVTARPSRWRKQVSLAAAVRYG